MKIVFAGTPDFAATYLESLAKDKRFNITAIISQEDKKIGRKQILTETETKQIGTKYGTPVFQPKTKSEITEILKKEKPDFFVVVAYGKILPKESLEVAKFNINVHGSILPKYRGASPIQSAVLNGDEETGISIMNVEEKMDVGAVWNINKCKIEKFDTSEEIFEKLKKFSENFGDDLEKIFKEGDDSKNLSNPEKNFKPTIQDENLATYCKKISKEDGKINFEKESAKEIFQKLNSFTPWPGIFCQFGDKKLKILKADYSENFKENFLDKIKNFFTQKNFGKIFETGEGKGKRVFIKTKSGNLELLEIQLEGKKSQDISAFINGHKDFVGNLLT